MKLFGILLSCLLTYSTSTFAADAIAIQVQEVRNPQHFTYHFGSVWVGSLSRIRFNVQNTGNFVLEREGFRMSGIYFQASTNCPRYLAPGEMCSFEIRYTPQLQGYHSGRMQMLFTDQNDVFVTVHGEATRY